MVHTREATEKLMVYAVRASSSVALTLVATKFYVWWSAQSVALLGSLIDSSLDLMASLVTLFAVKTAIRPADDDHRFGHGKAEALAGLFQSAIMGGSAIFLLFESLRSFAAPAAASGATSVMFVSFLAIALSLLLVSFQSYVVRHSGSLAISGDHLHYKGDLLMNLGVVAAAYLSSIGLGYADPIFGILIALYIIHGAYGVARPSIDDLMDREFSQSERDTIFNLVHSVQGVGGLHALKTRRAGRDRFIQMHIDVDGALSVKDGHMITTEVEALVGEEFPDTDILIHVDPMSEHTTSKTQKEV